MTTGRRIEVRMPALSPGLEDAEILAWHAGIGDHLVAGQPLVSVATTDAVVQVTAPEAGSIVTLVGSVGERLRVNALLAELDATHRDSGTVVGELPVTPSSYSEDSNP